MSKAWFVHHVLYRELTFNFTLTNSSPLRIGSSKSKSPLSPVDLQVLRIYLNGREVPYIPGSSLKGLFRNAVENILTSNNIRTCLMGNCANENYRDNALQSLIKRNAPIEDIVKKLDEYCLTCKIFGSNTYSSHISFSDAYPKDNVSLGVKTGIAINRRSGAAQQRALYTIEFVNPNAEFELDITILNLPNYTIGLLAKVIKLINNGFIRIGGFKSRGFGKFSLRLNSVKGIININNKLEVLTSSNNKLPALDDKDKEIIFDYNKPQTLLDNAEEVWDSYVNSNRSK